MYQVLYTAWRETYPKTGLSALKIRLHPPQKWQWTKEGFVELERKHCVHSTRFIGNGNSSVHLPFIQRILLDVATLSERWKVLNMPVNQRSIGEASMRPHYQKTGAC